MKKSIFILAFSIVMTGALLISCQPSVKKKVTAQERKQKAQQTLDQVHNDAALADQKKAAIAQDWQNFKNETESTINENEIQLTALKGQMNKTGKSIDSLYSKKIDLLDQKNKEFKTRIENYQINTNNDWESFKREFNHGMDELGKALKETSVDNKK